MPTTKVCPHCGETVLEVAIKCRFCQSDLTKPPTPKNFRYFTYVMHYRNSKEGGWVAVEDNPMALAAQHFWNDWLPWVADVDRSLAATGWEPIEPRNPSCVKIELVWNSDGYDPVRSAVAAVASGGASLFGQAFGFQKWWPSTITVKWRKPADEAAEDTFNMWLYKGKWERMEEDPDGKWHIWHRPVDWNPNDPNDKRWNKTPVK